MGTDYVAPGDPVETQGLTDGVPKDSYHGGAEAQTLHVEAATKNDFVDENKMLTQSKTCYIVAAVIGVAAVITVIILIVYFATKGVAVAAHTTNTTTNTSLPSSWSFPVASENPSTCTQGDLFKEFVWTEGGTAAAAENVALPFTNEQWPAWPPCGNCQSIPSVEFLMWFPREANNRSMENMPLFIFVPGTGMTPGAYSSELAAVAANGVVVLGVMIDWTQCSCDLCFSDKSLPTCNDWTIKMILKAAQIGWSGGNTDGQGNPYMLPPAIQGKLDPNSISLGGHSGGASAAFLAATQMTREQKATIKAIVLQHAAMTPSNFITDKQVSSVLDKGGEGIQLLTLCGSLCQISGTPCLWNLFAGENAQLPVPSTPMPAKPVYVNPWKTNGWQPPSCSWCSDCMAYAGCQVAAKIVSMYRKSGGQAVYVRGPWMHLTPTNVGFDTPVDNGCGFGSEPSPEADYLVSWLEYATLGNLSALQCMASVNNDIVTYEVPFCNVSIATNMIVQGYSKSANTP